MQHFIPSLSSLAALILLLASAVYAQHESQAYLPLSGAEISKKLPLQYVGNSTAGRPGYFESTADKPLAERLRIGPSGALVTQTDSGLIIRGKDKQNKDWSVHLGYLVLAYACRFYEADLDRNGIRDAVLVFPTGGNGLAPTSHLLAVTFDELGRPVTFEADGYFQQSENEIFDLIDLDNDRRAELIYMNFDDGYWITNLYAVRNGRWKRVSGRYGKRVYPLYTRFTYRENHKPTIPKRGRHPFAPDLSNTSPKLRGRLISYQWANVLSSEDILLNIRDRRGQEVSSKPVSWYASFAVVMDNKDGRRIASLSADEDVIKSLLSEIVAKGYEVTLYGQRRPDISSPEIVWAHSK